MCREFESMLDIRVEGKGGKGELEGRGEGGAGQTWVI